MTDTIVGIATAAGEGGVAIVRLSGGEVFLTGGAATVFTGSFEY